MRSLIGRELAYQVNHDRVPIQKVATDKLGPQHTHSKHFQRKLNGLALIFLARTNPKRCFNPLLFFVNKWQHPSQDELH